MIDPVLWNDWHVVADAASLRPDRTLATVLLGVPLHVGVSDVARDDGAPVRHALRYGLVWACLGEPARAIVDIPEAGEEGRCIATGGAIGVHVSAPRMIENFLDLGHLPYVHAGYLGADEQAEVQPYAVAPLPGGGIHVTRCRIFQPIASPAATDGYVVDYAWKVERPLTTCLYKANPVHPDRFDVIYLFAQPVGEERAIAHTLLIFVADGTSEKELRWFQQLIFLQDRPILENQIPKRLPIGEGMEMPVLADKSSVAYRRWLAEIGLRYGTVGGTAGARPLAA